MPGKPAIIVRRCRKGFRGRLGTALRRFLGAAAVLTLIPTAASAQATPTFTFERIRSYDVSIAIQHDGSIVVVERIDYDFGPREHHGIFRDIPDRLTFDDRYDRVYPIEDISVRGSLGTPDQFKTEKMGSLLRIQIGDPNKMISGRHLYTITYRVRGALNGFPGHDELYWNAIGSYWEVPIEANSVRVTTPGPIGRVACFAGDTGSALPCSRSHVDGRIATFRQDLVSPFGPWALGPGQGLTIVVGFPTGLVPTPHPVLEERWSFRRAFSVTPFTAGVSGGLLLLLLLGIGWLLWSRGRDRRAVGSPVDVAFGDRTTGGEHRVPLFERERSPVEYAPPDDIRPGQVGTLVDEVAGPLDVTATIVDLAVRGYLRIEEIPKKGWFGKPDWRLVKARQAGDELLPYETLLFDALFQGADDLSVEEEEPAALGNDASERDGGEVPPRPDAPDEPPPPRLAEVTVSSLRSHFSNRLKKAEDALYSDVVKRKWFAGRPDKVRATWHGRGFFLIVAGAALTWLAAAKSHLGLLPVPLIFAGLGLAWGSRWMPRRTAKGTGLVRRVFGFRTYIETAESQEAQFQERENIFSKYLPYAIVFGCTGKWARAFAGLNGELPSTSSWYAGTRPFTVDGFTSSIDHFAVSTAGTITATPAGSGHSGFSGGSSGGGGGGGGGGSW